MSDLKELIERELESFIEWEGDDKSIVTTTSTKLFAEHVAGLWADHVAAAGKMVAAVQGEPARHDWDEQDKCRRCGDRDWYAGPICTPKQPAEQQPVCPTCPTCYGRGWDMDCQNEFRPATCPDCAGSGKAEHSITVQESDSAAPDVQGEPVAWMTHHDEPMFFATAREASAYCDHDENPIPLYAAPQPAEQQHHRGSAELRRLCQARDEQRDGRLAALERAAKAESDVAGLVEALEQGFPLLGDDGLDEVEHHCEWVIQRERKRVHSILAAYREQGGEA